MLEGGGGRTGKKAPSSVAVLASGKPCAWRMKGMSEGRPQRGTQFAALLPFISMYIPRCRIFEVHPPPAPPHDRPARQQPPSPRRLLRRRPGSSVLCDPGPRHRGER